MRSKFPWTAITCLTLFSATLVVYWTVLSCGFISLDDPEYVTKNPQVLAGLSWSGLRYAFTSWHCSNWHPLTWLSLEADATLWGDKPTGYHATNMVLHAINSVLFFVALFRLTGAFQRSAWTAAFFALHPLHVESVAWVAERKDVLSALFLLLTIFAYLRYAKRPSLFRYSLVLLWFTLGLLAKPMLVTVPILLLLLDRWPLDRVQRSARHQGESPFVRQSPRTLFLEKLPLFVLAFADGLMTIIAQMGPVKLMVDIAIGTRVANLFNAYLWYLQKTFVPTNLIILYPHPEQNLSWFRIGLSVAVFVAITVWAFRRRSDRPHVLFGWSWFVISLLPVIGLIQVGLQAYADRYAYIPHMGLMTAIVWECHACFSKTTVGRISLKLAASFGVLACGMLTRTQTAYWINNETLWQHALDVDPQNGFAHAHYADVLLEKGDYERAMFHIESGLRAKRSGYVANAYWNWGRCLLELKRPAEAEEKFLTALQVDHNHEAALEDLAKLLKSQGRAAEAAEYSARHTAAFAKRLATMPENAAAQFTLGMISAQQGHAAQAQVYFEKAIQLAPQSAEGYTNLALVQMQLRRTKEAKANFRKAIELKPDLAVAYYFLAALLESENDIAGAKEHLKQALCIDPNNTKAQQALDRLSKQ
jgi:protein O-mannosyl-transferase